MKKVFLTLLGIIVVVGILAGAGFAGYRIGYQQGAARTVASLKAAGKLPQQNNGFNSQNMPMRNFGYGFNPQGMPMHNFGRGNEHGFKRGFGPGGYGIMGRGRGLGFLAPLAFLAHLAFWGLIIWLVYKVVKGSGWTITRRTVASPPAEASVTEEKSK